MKASVYTKYGSPEVLQLKEVKAPSPKNDEVLIRVHAATVNRSDCAMLRAKPFIMRFGTGLFKPTNPILGTDFAGIIEEVGKGVANFKVGNKVFGFDDRGLSSHAEYMTVSKNNALAIMPENVTYEEAAASIEGVHYAYNFVNKVDLKSGQKVLVNGATGAIGSAAVQLVRYYGAEVTAVCHEKNFELIKSLGATHVIDFTKEDFTKSGGKYHYVFDTVGKSTFSKCKPLLLPDGVYISSELGPNVENIYLPLITSLIGSLPGQKGSKKVKFPLPTNRLGSVLLVKELMQHGKFKAVIDKTYPLAQIPDAFRYVLEGQKIGTVVISMLL